MYKKLQVELMNVYGVQESMEAMRLPKKSKGDTLDDIIGPRDQELVRKLILAGDEHAKAIRGVKAYIKLWMQVGWMIEFETYGIGVDPLSTSSSMHGELKGLHGIELAEQKQSDLPDKVYCRIVVMSYQALRRVYSQRRNHRHPDWAIFCDFVETLPYFDTLIYPLPQKL